MFQISRIIEVHLGLLNFYAISVFVLILTLLFPVLQCFPGGTRPTGIQDTHTWHSCRYGGVGIFLALVSVGFLELVGVEYYKLVLTVFPIFIIGVLDDLTGKLSPTTRLVFLTLFSYLSGEFFWGWLTGVGIPILDSPLESVLVFQVCLSLLAIAGIINAFNMIDGVNGLCALIALIIISGIVAITPEGLTALRVFGLVLIAAIIGFLLNNMIVGRVFLGDGGAYLLGAAIGWMAIINVSKDPSLSPWCFFTMCIHPIVETMVTVTRRFLRRQKIFYPDKQHLHSCLFRLLIQYRVFQSRRFIVSSIVGLCLALPTGVMVIIAIENRTDGRVLQISCLVFLALFLIVRNRLNGYLKKFD